MTSLYFTRLACLSMAVLFLIQTAGGALTALTLPRYLALSKRWEPRRAAAMLVCLRWLPSVLGGLVVCFLCIPSYLYWEPLRGEEEIGFVCSLLAVAGLVSYAFPLLQVAVHVIRTELRLRSLAQTGQGRVCVLDASGPGMALAGLFEWRLLVSRDVMQVLTPDEMAVAVRHEQAHQKFKDNFARALLDAAPLGPGGGALRAAWKRNIEWAADDWAVAGDAAQSAALASALVSVARLGSPSVQELMGSTLVSGRPCELRERVERLLEPGGGDSERVSLLPISLAFGLLSAGLIVLAGNNAALRGVHRALELLIG